MKVYVLYVLDDYATAIFMSIDKKLCEQEKKRLEKTVKHSMWIEDYDFSAQKSFELNCD
jgi:hypothetical protein